MEHSLSAEAFGVRLRPVRFEDAGFIVWLRHLDHARGKVGDSAWDIRGQENWLAEQFAREGDYYFVIETSGGIPVGTVGIYNPDGASAESGRYIIRPGVWAAVPSSILTVELAFGRIGLKELRTAVVATNKPVLSINPKLGFRQIEVEHAGRVIEGHSVDMVHFVLSADDWPEARARLVPLARRAEQQIRHWDRAQRFSKRPRPQYIRVPA